MPREESKPSGKVTSEQGTHRLRSQGQKDSKCIICREKRVMCVMILLGVRMNKTMPLSGAEWSVAEIVWGVRSSLGHSGHYEKYRKKPLWDRSKVCLATVRRKDHRRVRYDKSTDQEITVTVH